MSSNEHLPRLLDGEVVVWTGKPRRGVQLRTIDAFLIPFSIFWCAFVVFWNLAVYSSDTPPTFALVGYVFLLFGAYFLFGRFIHESMLKRRLRYAVTNQRVIISKTNSKTVTSLEIRQLPALELNEHANGTGTLRFGPSPPLFGANGFAVWSSAFDQTPQFLSIENPSDVYELVRKQVENTN